MGKFPFKASGKARVIGQTEGLVKMIAACGFAKTFEATLSGMAATVHTHPDPFRSPHGSDLECLGTVNSYIALPSV